MGDRIGVGETRKVVLVQLRSEAMDGVVFNREREDFFIFGFSVFVLFIYYGNFI